MCIGIITKDAVEAIIEDMVILATETILSPTTILLTEVGGLGTEARKVRGSIQVAVGPAEIVGTEQVTGRGIDHIKKDDPQRNVMIGITCFSCINVIFS